MVGTPPCVGLSHLCICIPVSSYSLHNYWYFPALFHSSTSHILNSFSYPIVLSAVLLPIFIFYHYLNISCPMAVLHGQDVADDCIIAHIARSYVRLLQYRIFRTLDYFAAFMSTGWGRGSNWRETRPSTWTTRSCWTVTLNLRANTWRVGHSTSWSSSRSRWAWCQPRWGHFYKVYCTLGLCVFCHRVVDRLQVV